MGQLDVILCIRGLCLAMGCDELLACLRKVLCIEGWSMVTGCDQLLACPRKVATKFTVSAGFEAVDARSAPAPGTAAAAAGPHDAAAASTPPKAPGEQRRARQYVACELRGAARLLVDTRGAEVVLDLDVQARSTA